MRGQCKGESPLDEIDYGQRGLQKEVTNGLKKLLKTSAPMIKGCLPFQLVAAIFDFVQTQAGKSTAKSSILPRQPVFLGGALVHAEGAIPTCQNQSYLRLRNGSFFGY